MVNEIIIAVLLFWYLQESVPAQSTLRGREDAVAVLRKSGQKEKLEKYHRSEEGTDRRHDL